MITFALTLCPHYDSQLSELRKIVERHARDNRVQGKIEPGHVYDSHPPQERLFPSPIDFAFEAHGACIIFLE